MAYSEEELATACNQLSLNNNNHNVEAHTPIKRSASNTSIRLNLRSLDNKLESMEPPIKLYGPEKSSSLYSIPKAEVKVEPDTFNSALLHSTFALLPTAFTKTFNSRAQPTSARISAYDLTKACSNLTLSNNPFAEQASDEFLSKIPPPITLEKKPTTGTRKWLESWFDGRDVYPKSLKQYLKAINQVNMPMMEIRFSDIDTISGYLMRSGLEKEVSNCIAKDIVRAVEREATRLQPYMEIFQKPNPKVGEHRQVGVKVQIVKANLKNQKGIHNTKKDKKKAAREAKAIQQSRRRIEEAHLRKAYPAADPDARIKFFNFINYKTQRRAEKEKLEQTKERRACKVEKRRRQGRIPWLPDDTPGTKPIVDRDMDVKME